MKICVYSTKRWVRDYFDEANREYSYQLHYLEARLDADTASLAQGCDVVCLFVNDHADREVIGRLHEAGVGLIALRCAGYNNVDLDAAAEHRIAVARVPAYSPHAVAEHAVALILSLNRRLHRAYNRVREGNFALDGLLGFDLHERTIGVVGTGTIGRLFARIMQGFGTTVLAYDRYPNDELAAGGVRYVELDELYRSSDVISLHCPLTPDTRHLINSEAVGLMKRGAMIINTSRGALVDTGAVIEGLKSGQIGSLGLDVYEEEDALFFEDLSDTVIQDDTFSRLLTFPNVLVTAHQAFFTHEAVENISRTTLANVEEWKRVGAACANCMDSSR